MNQPRLVILGCGFLGTEVARLALARGHSVIATLRHNDKAAAIDALGAETSVATSIDPAWLRDHLARDTHVLVTYPPEPASDQALAKVAAEQGARVVYISSTAVYGTVRGRVDQQTQAKPDEPRGQRRFDAENIWAQANAIVLRAPAIYGPGRGLHLRIARGEHQLPDSGDNFVSRLHVHDLARLCLAAFERGVPNTRYVVGDMKPCPQREITHWLCQRMRTPMLAPTALTEVSPTLRNDRQVDPTWALSQLGVTLTYPTYIEGYESCLQHDALSQ